MRSRTSRDARNANLARNQGGDSDKTSKSSRHFSISPLKSCRSGCPLGASSHLPGKVRRRRRSLEGSSSRGRQLSRSRTQRGRVATERAREVLKRVEKDPEARPTAALSCGPHLSGK